MADGLPHSESYRLLVGSEMPSLSPGGLIQKYLPTANQSL
jgi:hypothetical protein